MASPTALAARAVLREAKKPLTIKELTPRVLERVTLTTKKPEQTVRNALQMDAACVSDGDGRWVYLPTFVRGAAMRSPVRLASPETGELAVTVELVRLLWPLVEPGEMPRPARLKLAGGPTVRVGWSRKNGVRTGYCDAIAGILKLPDPFWSWWGRQQAEGANTLVVRCEDGEAGRYACDAIRTPAITYDEAVEAHRPLQDAAEKAIRRSQGGVWLTDLAGRLIARGIYHRDEAAELPPSFLPGLMIPLGRFVLGGGGVIQLGYDLTPGLARVLAVRLVAYWFLDEERIRRALELPAQPPPAIAPPPPEEPVEPAPVEGVRVKVTLTWRPDVWRRIELRADQTLEDLHDAIQDAFGWDDAHLYAFFMSGAAWDQLTEIARPLGPQDIPPTADDVRFVDLDLRPGKHFLYVFDFGDDLRHLVTYEGTFPLDGEASAPRFPRVVGGEGQPPDQYADDEEEGWWDEDGDEEGNDLAALIDEGLALGVLPISPGAAGRPPVVGGPLDLSAVPSALAYEPSDLAAFGFPTLTRFDFPPPDPKLRRLPVDLDQLAAAFIEEPEEIAFYLDLETGALRWLLGDETDPEERRLRAAIVADPLRYAKIPNEGEAGARRDMEAFLATIEDEELEERLRAAIASTRPRRRFFDALAHYPEEQARWIEFDDRRRAERVVAWLASRGIAPELPRRR